MDKNTRKISKEGQPDLSCGQEGQAGLGSIEVFETKKSKDSQSSKDSQKKPETREARLARFSKPSKEANTAPKSTTSKLKERWLLTRKTWRYMSDAGKKIFPEGVNPNCFDDVPKVEEHFQKISQKAKDFVLWPITQQQESPKSRRRRARPGSPISDQENREDETDDDGATAKPPRFGGYGRERLLSTGDMQFSLHPDVYQQLLRTYGASTLQSVACRLLEEQLTEEDEYDYDDEEIEEIEVKGIPMRCVGAQTDPQLDMCIQTDYDEAAEDQVKVGAETYAETQAAFAEAKSQKPEKGSALKRFLARRESNLGKLDDKDKKGGVAAKLAALEAVAATNKPKVPEKQPEKQEKKNFKNVFKMGLKCDMDAPTVKKGSVKGSKDDKFKTVNYDKTLRDIKSKYVSDEEDEEEEEIVQKDKAVGPKKRRGKGIQVGDPLPQFILSGFRVSSPVEIIHATKRRIRRISSKAESTDMSSSECSLSIPSSLPTSPRYSITVTDEQGTRDLVVSEAEAYRLSQMGVSVSYNKRGSIDASVDTSEFEQGIREGVTMSGGAYQFQRSISALQASGHLTQTLYNMRGRGSSSSYPGGGSGALKASHGLLQSLLPAVMQRNRSTGSGHASRLVAKRIWRTRSKSQSRASAGTTSIWTPMVSTKVLFLLYFYNCKVLVKLIN